MPPPDGCVPMPNGAPSDRVVAVDEAEQVVGPGVDERGARRDAAAEVAVDAGAERPRARQLQAAVGHLDVGQERRRGAGVDELVDGRHGTEGGGGAAPEEDLLEGAVGRPVLREDEHRDARHVRPARWPAPPCARRRPRPTPGRRAAAGCRGRPECGRRTGSAGRRGRGRRRCRPARRTQGAGKVFLRQAAGFGLTQPRSLRVLLDQVVEADELPGGGDAHAELLFLQLPHPAVAPGPQAHRIADQAAGAFEPQLPLQKGLGRRVVAEDRAVAKALQVQTAFPEKAECLVARLLPGYPEVYGGFGEGAVEIVASDRQGQGGDEGTGEDEEEIPFVEMPFHFYLQCESGGRGGARRLSGRLAPGSIRCCR